MPEPRLITPHFALHEFALDEARAAERGCVGAPYPEAWIDSRLRPLCDVLEVLRAHFGGRPVKIHSGYRTPEYNVAVDGAERSQHVQGRAADISIKGVEPRAVYQRALALYRGRRLAIGGLGIYDWGVHVDIRPGALETWDERTARSRVTPGG